MAKRSFLRQRLIKASTNLTKTETTVLDVINDYQGENPTAWPGYGRIAKDAKVSGRYVKYVVQSLIEKGVLQIERRGAQKTNLYAVDVSRLTFSYLDAKKVRNWQEQLAEIDELPSLSLVTGQHCTDAQDGVPTRGPKNAPLRDSALVLPQHYTNAPTALDTNAPTAFEPIHSEPIQRTDPPQRGLVGPASQGNTLCGSLNRTVDDLTEAELSQYLKEIETELHWKPSSKDIAGGLLNSLTGEAVTLKDLRDVAVGMNDLRGVREKAWAVFLKPKWGLISRLKECAANRRMQEKELELASDPMAVFSKLLNDGLSAVEELTRMKEGFLRIMEKECPQAVHVLPNGDIRYDVREYRKEIETYEVEAFAQLPKAEQQRLLTADAVTVDLYPTEMQIALALFIKVFKHFKGE